MLTLYDVPTITEAIIPIILHLEDRSDWHVIVQDILAYHHIKVKQYNDVCDLSELEKQLSKGLESGEPIVIIVDLRLDETHPVYDGSDWLASNIERLRQYGVYTVVVSGYLPQPTLAFLDRLEIPRRNIFSKDPWDEDRFIDLFGEIAQQVAYRQSEHPLRGSKRQMLPTRSINQEHYGKLKSETDASDWDVSARLFGSKVVDDVVWLRDGRDYPLELTFRPAAQFDTSSFEDIVLDLFVIGSLANSEELHWRIPVSDDAAKKVFQIRFSKESPRNMLTILIYFGNKLKRIIDFDVNIF